MRTREHLAQDHAYLVVRSGASWRDVYRLEPDRVLTVGRAAENRIVLADEMCSRRHCEIYGQAEQWKVRDLDSRNGTEVDGKPIIELELSEGNVIQIGSTELMFSFDLGRIEAARNGEDQQSATITATGPEILDRRKVTSYLSLEDLERAEDLARLGEDLASLYRLALSMAEVDDISDLGRRVLDQLCKRTGAEIGALLITKKSSLDLPRLKVPNDFDLTAFHSADGDQPNLSHSVSEIVLDSDEAVLANDLADDSRLSDRDSLGELRARGVICAPMRWDEKTYGLVHLYTMNPQIRLGTNDLDFTLAVANQLAIVVNQKHERDRLTLNLTRAESENRNLKQQLRSETEIIGDSPPMQQLKTEIARVAPTEATVLVRGESGVGKELVARALHAGSGRASGPLVCLNCAALAESLLESELFGHEKGAFTGATAKKAGKFEQADGGTLFLDEVGEMPMSIQAKFLRAMEGHAFERVGGSRPISADVRIVAATNRDLETAVREGDFRRDLYFRLNVVIVTVPPLKRRTGDIDILARHFVQKFSMRSDRVIRGLTKSAVELLRHHSWPGNVRELQNTIERAVILCEGDEIADTDLQLMPLDQEEVSTDTAEFAPVSLAEVERRHILATLTSTDGNKSKAAQILGIERSTLDRKLKRYRDG
ncbi:sigma 54-interacting transcriptional regulator [Stratiformator vulcanicus]|nr:sigma 54-interacting transcriptional regulator [Stratiformator vulcanicus]